MKQAAMTAREIAEIALRHSRGALEVHDYALMDASPAVLATVIGARVRILRSVSSRSVALQL